jgi:hypothetical protein
MFPLVREAVASVLPVEKLRYIGLSHVEADECGSLNEWLAAAPQSVPLCGTVAALVSIGDMADRAPRALADGERLPLGQHTVRWFDTPHLPHAWECGFLTPVSCLRGLPRQTQPHLRACTVARGVARGHNCSVILLMHSLHD